MNTSVPYGNEQASKNLNRQFYLYTKPYWLSEPSPMIAKRVWSPFDSSGSEIRIAEDGHLVAESVQS